MLRPLDLVVIACGVLLILAHFLRYRSMFRLMAFVVVCYVVGKAIF
jgi:hypothetical protein